MIYCNSNQNLKKTFFVETDKQILRFIRKCEQ